MACGALQYGPGRASGFDQTTQGMVHTHAMGLVCRPDHTQGSSSLSPSPNIPDAVPLQPVWDPHFVQSRSQSGRHMQRRLAGAAAALHMVATQLDCATCSPHSGRCSVCCTQSSWSMTPLHVVLADTMCSVDPRLAVLGNMCSSPKTAGAGTVCGVIWSGWPLYAARLLLWTDCIACSTHSGICAACSMGPRLARAATGSGLLGKREGSVVEVH